MPHKGIEYRLPYQRRPVGPFSREVFFCLVRGNERQVGPYGTKKNLPDTTGGNMRSGFSVLPMGRLSLPGPLQDADARLDELIGELYHLKEDPGEWRNLYDDERWTAIREQVTAELLMHLVVAWTRWPAAANTKQIPGSGLLGGRIEAGNRIDWISPPLPQSNRLEWRPPAPGSGPKSQLR